MAIFGTQPWGQRVVVHGIPGQCRCGKPSDTEVQLAGAGGQYDQICWVCMKADYSPRWESPDSQDFGYMIEYFSSKTVRFRNYHRDPWVEGKLCGFRVDPDAKKKILFYIDSYNRSWTYCEVHRMPVV